MFKIKDVSKASKLPHTGTAIEFIPNVAILLRERPFDLALVAIDIPIGLTNTSRKCDFNARKLLGKPRSSSVFPAPCRAALSGGNYVQGSEINRQETGKKLTKQAWGIVPKIKEVDDAIRHQTCPWAIEVHPELCFRAMNAERSLANRKKTTEGKIERKMLLTHCFPRIEQHMKHDRPSGVAIDDLLDAAAAAWTALRYFQGRSKSVGSSDLDEIGLPMMIHY